MCANNTTQQSCHVSVRIPIRLVSTPNVHEHWRAKWKRESTQKKIVRLMLNPLRRSVILPCTVTFIKEGPRTLDDDNFIASLKHIRDEVADWLIPGQRKGHTDSDPRISWVYRQEKSKTYALLIEITASAETADHHHGYNPSSSCQGPSLTQPPSSPA